MVRPENPAPTMRQSILRSMERAGAAGCDELLVIDNE
jgi:hypothetical protein